MAPRLRQLGWFVALWGGGVVTVLIVALLIRMMLGL